MVPITPDVNVVMIYVVCQLFNSLSLVCNLDKKKLARMNAGLAERHAAEVMLDK